MVSDVSLRAFLKTLTCHRNKTEPQTAKLVSHTAFQKRSTEKAQEMKKTLITSVTAFAIVLNAGVSMAGPLRGDGQRGQAQDIRASVSQALNHADGTANNNRATKTSASAPGAVFMCSAGRYNADLGYNQRCAFDLDGSTPGH